MTDQLITLISLALVVITPALVMCIFRRKP